MIGVTAFFAHETIAPEDWSKTQLAERWEAAKQRRTEALEVLKEMAKGTPQYDAYIKEKEATDIEFAKLEQHIESVKFLNFNDLQQWLGEFGWAMGLFIYSLYNLVMVFIRKPNTFFGESLWHTSHITVAIFFIRWSFNRKDFLIMEYFTYNILTAVLVVLATYLLVRHKEKIYYQYLKSQKAFNAISRFALKGVVKHIKAESMEDYKQERARALKDGML